MRRYIFYLTIALLTFGSGSLVVFKFYFKRNEQIAANQIKETIRPENKERIPVQTTQAEDEGTIDEEQGAFEVFKPIIRKWLRGRKIKQGYNEINSEIVKEITGKNEKDLNEREISFWKDSGFGFVAYLIDVDGDGENELAIRNQCAPVGNCQFWLFKKSGKKYRILLKTLYSSVQTFKLKPSRTKGYFDLETKDHETASSGAMVIYKFDGEGYKARKCFEYDYDYLIEGRLYTGKTPQITSAKCSE